MMWEQSASGRTLRAVTYPDVIADRLLGRFEAALRAELDARAHRDKRVPADLADDVPPAVRAELDPDVRHDARDCFRAGYERCLGEGYGGGDGGEEEES